MTPYGKTAQHAIAAVSRLAQAYDPAKKAKLGSAEIADARGLPRPVVAKVLTTLSQAGLVAATETVRAALAGLVVELDEVRSNGD